LTATKRVAATATTCAVNPNTLASGSGTATVAVTTMVRGHTPPTLPIGRLYLRLLPQWILLFLLSPLLVILVLRSIRTRRECLEGELSLIALVLFLMLEGIGCGGGGSSGPSPPPPPTGTPAGTYAVTVTGASASTTHTTTLTVIVN